MKKVKLLVLRILLVISLFGAWIGTCFTKKTYHFPVEWLLHYLVGTGKDKKVPAKVIKEAEAVFAEAIRINHMGNESLGGLYAVNHSTLYEGSGFHERPSLFYILGCFLFEYEPRTGKVWGSDHYDWHSDPDANSYFTSPLGYNKWIVKACDLAGRIFGDDLFVTKRSDFDYLIVAGGYDGQAAISNKLWEVLEVVGAKEFDTVFEGHIHVSKKDVSKALRHHKRYGRQYAISRIENIICRWFSNFYDDVDYDNSIVNVSFYNGKYVEASIDLYDEDDYFLGTEEHLLYYIDEEKAVRRATGYDLALAKAAAHAASFNQRVFKEDLMIKRGLITCRSRRVPRPRRGRE